MEDSTPSQSAPNQTTPYAKRVHYADEEARFLLADHLHVLDDPAAHGWAKVKENASRTVYCGVIQGQEIFLKRYHSRLLIHRLRRLLGMSDALREFCFIQRLVEADVSCAPLLAAVCSGGTEWLATRAVPDVMPGDAWHLRQLSRGEAGKASLRLAATRLGQMIARMHAAGIVHMDMHCGNLLVQGDDEPRIVMTDLHRATHRRRLSRRACAMSLAQLFHDRFDFTTRTDRLRFLSAYLRTGRPGTLRGWQTMIEDFAARHTRRQHAQRDRRIFARNQYFSPLRLDGGWRGHVVLASKRRMAGSAAAKQRFTLDQWREVLQSPGDLFTGDGVEVVKDSTSSLVVRRPLRVGGCTIDVYVKRSRRKFAWKALLDCFRPSRATRTFRLGHQLLTRGIATALPLAALERRCGPFLCDTVSITETVAHSTHLNLFLRTHLATPPVGDVPLTPAQQRHLAQEVLWQLGRMVQRLHDNRLAHRDLKASNILVRWARDISPELVLVDLDGLKRVAYMSMKRRFQGLMRLNVSLLECPTVNRAGRLRMLLGYLRRPGCGRINFKPYWRVLQQWSMRKINDKIESARRKQRAVRTGT